VAAVARAARDQHLKKSFKNQVQGPML
jgi:hypothetical protein